MCNRSLPDRSPYDKGTSAYLDAALDLRQRHGWSLIPVRGKQPACRWKRCQIQAPGEAELTRLFARPGITGLAVICGTASGDLAIRDFDQPEPYLAWAEQHPDLATVLPTVQTARGYHVYLRSPDTHTIPFEDGELRGEGGYCLLPPSLHPDTGQPYHWLIPPRNTLPLVDPLLSGLCPPPSPLSPLSSYCYKPKSVEGDNIDGLIEGAIRATLPTGEGMRHACLFRFERRLQGIPALRDRPAEAMEPIVREWWERCVHLVREKRWAETWRDFRSGWVRVRCPLTPGASEQVIVETLPSWLDRTAPLDPWAGDDGRREQQLLRLELVCEVLSGLWSGRQFPLGQEFAAALLNVSQPTAGKYLTHLERSGLIVRTAEHSHLKGLAREWLYRGPCVVELAA